MFFNYWIGFLNESFLFLAVCVGLNLLYFKWNKYGDVVNSLLSAVSGTLLLLFPMFVGIFYKYSKNYKLLIDRNEDFLARYDNAVNGLNFKRRGKSVFISLCISLARKLWLAHIVVF